MIDSHEKTKVRERTNFRESPFYIVSIMGFLIPIVS